MRFLLYNIRYGTGTSGIFHFPVPYFGYLRNTRKNLSRIIAYIKSVRPEIIGLVEVDSGSFRTGRFNQAEVIARAMKQYYVYQSKYATSSLIGRLPVLDKQGNAFLTSNEIKAQKFHYFQKGVKRLVIELELEDVIIFLVHLSLKFRHRHHQLKDLYTLFKSINKPVIVAGDFNVLWGDHELQLFLGATGLQNANTQERPSYPSWSPRRQLDFILHSPEIRVTDFSIPRISLSDHMPLVCDFEVA